MINIMCNDKRAKKNKTKKRMRIKNRKINTIHSINNKNTHYNKNKFKKTK